MNRIVQDIMFYDFDFNLKHIENKFISAAWTLCYNDIGTFEAHFDLQSDTLPVIMENDFLIAVQGNKSAVVVGKQLGSDLAVFGRTCNWLLTKRVADEITADDKTVCGLVSDLFKAAPVSVEVPEGDIGNPYVRQSDKCEAFKLIQETLQTEKLGHEMVMNSQNSGFVFRILKGCTDNPLVISTAERTAFDVTVNSDFLSLYTEGWYKQGSGAADSANGNDYVWSSIQKTVPKSDLYRFEGIISGESEAEATAELMKADKISNIQGKTAGIYLDQNYSLGDVVTVEWQAGAYKKRAKKRISSVNIWYESGNIGEEPAFEDIEETEIN